MYCVAIFLLSSLSVENLPPLNTPESDKVAHALLFGGLALTLGWGIRRAHPKASIRLVFLIPVVFASLFGATDELHQVFVPTRNADWWDLAADALGATLAQCGLWAIRDGRRPIRSESR